MSMSINREKDYIQTLEEMMKNSANKGISFEKLLEKAKLNLLKEEQKRKNTELVSRAIKDLKTVGAVSAEVQCGFDETIMLTITCHGIEQNELDIESIKRTVLANPLDSHISS